MIKQGVEITWRKCIPYVLLGHLVRMLIALMVAYPLSSIAQKALGATPKGDVALFDSGAMILAEFVRLHGVAISASLQHMLSAALIILVINMIVVAWVLASMAPSAPVSQRTRWDIARSALESVNCIAGLSVIMLVFVGFVMVVSFLIGLGISSIMENWTSQRAADISLSIILLLGAMIAILGIITGDIARAAAVIPGTSSDRSIVNSIARSLHVMRHQLGITVILFTSRALMIVTLISLNISAFLWLGITTALHALFVISLQQISLIGIGMLRSWWLADAMRLILRCDPSAHSSSEVIHSTRVAA